MLCVSVCACAACTCARPPLGARQICREKAIKDKDEYYKKRQKDKKTHLKRTAKGQPVTKNIISSILDKLQNE